MFKKIKNFIRTIQIRRSIELMRKRKAIFSAMKDYYETLYQGKSVDLMPAVMAEQILKKVLKTPKDINKHYKKLLEFQAL